MPTAGPPCRRARLPTSEKGFLSSSAPALASPPSQKNHLARRYAPSAKSVCSFLFPQCSHACDPNHLLHSSPASPLPMALIHPHHSCPLPAAAPCLLSHCYTTLPTPHSHSCFPCMFPDLVPHIPASPQNNILHAVSSDSTPLSQDRSCCETVLDNFLGHFIPSWQDTHIPALTHPLLIPREIWNTKDSVVAQIGSGGSFHEFCTSVCLSLYEAQQHRPAPQSADASDTSRCSVCHKPGEVNKSLVLPMSWMKCLLGPAALSLGQDQAFARFSCCVRPQPLSWLGLTPKLFLALRFTASCHCALLAAFLTWQGKSLPSPHQLPVWHFPEF